VTHFRQIQAVKTAGVLASLASRAAACVAAVLTLGLPAAAHAHDPGLSSLAVQIAPARIIAVLSLAAADARIAADASGGALDAFAADSIELMMDGTRLSGTVETQATDGEAGTTFTLVFDRARGSRLTIRSEVPGRLARGHRELVTVRGTAGRRLAERMLDTHLNAVDVDLRDEPASTSTAGQFFGLGLHHILGGYDHLLFLAALLLGLQRLSGVAKTVTAFTVAHSLTLSLAVLGLVHMPASVVEPIIAVSIVSVGIENLVRGQVDSRWKLTFAFGLVHGFGFAGALQELGIGTGGTDIVAPLAWFNTGVEVGQLGVAILVWPLLRRLNARPALRVRLAPVCSLLVVGAGMYWMVERTLL
jgi:hydrogenase/urease accessory protein HupE